MELIKTLILCNTKQVLTLPVIPDGVIKTVQVGHLIRSDCIYGKDRSPLCGWKHDRYDSLIPAFVMVEIQKLER